MCCGVGTVFWKDGAQRGEVECVLGECSTGNAKGTSGSLTHSGSPCVTAEAIGAAACPPSSAQLSSWNFSATTGERSVGVNVRRARLHWLLLNKSCGLTL